MSGGQVRPWDMPVVRALDAVEQLPGFRADQVEWTGFRYWRSGLGEQMEWASIYAYPSGAEQGFVRFSVRDGEFAVAGPQNRALTTDEVADTLNAPAVSAEKAVTLVIPALATALARYNTAHTPHACPSAIGAVQGPVGSYGHDNGPVEYGGQPALGR